MYIITVIPIARGIPFDTLTYFHTDSLESGTLVMMAFGKQQIYGIAVESHTLLEAKSMVKQATFSLKKITTIIGHLPYFGAIVRALQETSVLTLTPVGALASNVIPHILFEYMSAEKMATLLQTPPSAHTYAEEVVVGTSAIRADNYKRLIRSAFAEKKTVLFIAPTIKSLLTWASILEKGIAKHVVTFHSKLTKKTIRANMSLIKSDASPLLLFATPGHMVIPRSDVGIIIAEDESYNGYKTNDRFASDLRICIKLIAQELSVKLVWGDTVPRFETLARLDAATLPRAYVPDKLTIVPIEQYRTILPTEIIELIRHAEKRKQRLFIYTDRKGVAPLSRCGDCGTVVTCEECTLPMVLRNRIHGDGTKERYFICTHCAATLLSSHTCLHCGSWNILPIPIGTESIRDAVISIVGSESVVVIDSDSTPDTATLATQLDYIQKQKFVIVIGTVKMLPFINHIHYAVFPFFDRLLSIPSLYATEDALRLVMECNERVSDGVIIATKNADFPFLKQLSTHKINSIITDELSLRKDLGYPPYGTIVKVSITVPDGYRHDIASQIHAFFDAHVVPNSATYTPLPPRRVQAGSMKVLLSWIIKAEIGLIEAVGTELVQLLETFRYVYHIEQNPERL